jgi:hypothetical protein
VRGRIRYNGLAAILKCGMMGEKTWRNYRFIAKELEALDKTGIFPGVGAWLEGVIKQKRSEDEKENDEPFG